MQNDRGEIVDIYIPRKCSATNRIISAKEHGSMQLNIAKVDEFGHFIRGDNETYVIAGFMRSKGHSDASMNRLLNRDGHLSFSK